MLKRSVKILVVVLVSLFLVTSAFAQSDGEVKFNGVVTAVNDDGTLTVQAEDGTEYIVDPGDDFDLTGVAVGDTVEVEGVDDGYQYVTAEKVKVEDAGGDSQGKGNGKGNGSSSDDGDEDTGGEDTSGDGAGEGDGSKLQGKFCGESDKQHPVIAGIAETYGADYSAIQGSFCEDNFGLGQVMLAYQAQELTGLSAAELLAMRAEGQGWGKILVDLGVIGKPEHAGPPEGKGKPDCEGAGGDEEAGGDAENKGKKPSDDCKPGGKPEDKETGKPEDKGNGGGNGKGKGGGGGDDNNDSNDG